LHNGNQSGGEYKVANELNEQLNAAPEPEMRAAAPVMPQEAEPAAAIEAIDTAPAQTANDANDTPSPVIRLVDNKNFKSFSYGDDDSQPGLQNKGEKHLDQTTEAINAIRKDISLIAVGSTQVRANQNLVNRQAGNDDAHTSVRGQQELNRQLTEQRRIEAWNNTRTVIGGVSMTQAQALSALQKINEDPDAFVKRALEEGRIKKGEEEEYKRTAKRMQELMEKDKEGKLSEPEKQEKMDFEASRMGKIVGSDIGKTVEKDNAYNQSATIKGAERDGRSYAQSGISEISVKSEFSAAAQQRNFTIEAAPESVVAKITVENAEQVRKNNASVPGLG
jgi:hypothetical protein